MAIITVIILAFSWIIPLLGIFLVDNNLLKIFFTALLLGNFFLGGSATGAKRMADEGSLSHEQWLKWESINLFYKIAVVASSIAIILMA